MYMYVLYSNEEDRSSERREGDYTFPTAPSPVTTHCIWRTCQLACLWLHGLQFIGGVRIWHVSPGPEGGGGLLAVDANASAGASANAVRTLID